MKRKNHEILKDCQIFNVVKVMGYSNIAVHVQIEKSQILNFFLHLHSEKKRIILVQHLHSKSMHARCHSSLIHVQDFISMVKKIMEKSF